MSDRKTTGWAVSKCSSSKKSIKWNSLLGAGYDIGYKSRIVSSTKVVVASDLAVISQKYRKVETILTSSNQDISSDCMHVSYTIIYTRAGCRAWRGSWQRTGSSLSCVSSPFVKVHVSIVWRLKIAVNLPAFPIRHFGFQLQQKCRESGRWFTIHLLKLNRKRDVVNPLRYGR